jgi:hypothetical protein
MGASQVLTYKNVSVGINNVNTDIDFIEMDLNRADSPGDWGCARYTGRDMTRWFVEEWGRGSI